MQAVLEGKFDDIELWAEQAQTLGEDLGFSKRGTRTKKMKTFGSVCVSNVVRSACNTLSIYFLVQQESNLLTLHCDALRSFRERWPREIQCCGQPS